MNGLFLALIGAATLALLFSAASDPHPHNDWAWYTGVACITAAATIVIINGWAT